MLILNCPISENSNIIYNVFQEQHFCYIFNDSVKNQLILIIFGQQHPEETWRRNIINLSISESQTKDAVLLPHYLGSAKKWLFDNTQQQWFLINK